MALTELEKILISYIKLSGLTKGEGAIIFLKLRTEEQQMEMCDFFYSHETTTKAEIMTEVQRITKE